MARRALSCVLYLVHLLLLHEVFGQAIVRPNVYPNATASHIAGKLWITVPDYSSNVSSVVVRQVITTESSCNCQMSCFTLTWCTAATYDTATLRCSLTESAIVKAVPTPGSVYIYKPDYEVYFKPDGLFYLVLPQKEAYGTMIRKCEAQGFRAAQGKTRLSFNILKELNKMSYALPKWIGGSRNSATATGVFNWDDGTLFDTSFLDGVSLGSSNGDEALVYWGSDRLYGRGKVIAAGMICQANFLNIIW